MPFLLPNKQRQSTEGNSWQLTEMDKIYGITSRRPAIQFSHLRAKSLTFLEWTLLLQVAVLAVISIFRRLNQRSLGSTADVW